MSEYKEIIELYEYCQKIGVQTVKEPLFDGFKIKFKNGSDVVQHNSSYGGKYGFVEPAIGCDIDYTAVSLSSAKKLILKYKDKLNCGEEGKLCKYYAEFEGICCHGECSECADICTYSDEQEKCKFYEKE